MKVIHIVEAFAGGVFNSIRLLINNINNCEYIIIHGKRDKTPSNIQKYFPENVKLIRWRHALREINPIKDSLALYELISLLKKYKNEVDIIHLHSSKAGFLGRLGARLLGLQDKVIYNPRGAAFLRCDISNKKKAFYMMLEKLGAQFGGLVVACSKSESIAFNNIGINAIFINNGYNCNNHSDSLKNFNKKITSKTIIGTIGRITHQKNPQLFNQIAQHFNNIEFLWIGDGELKNLLTSKNITITGWLSQQELSALLSTTVDIYLSTSLWEGLPVAVLQAMCYKKPLILHNCVGNRDLVVNEYNGYLFETLEEAINVINKLLSNKRLISLFGLNSYELFLREFSIKHTAKQYKQLYEKLCSKN